MTGPHLALLSLYMINLMKNYMDDAIFAENFTQKNSWAAKGIVFAFVNTFIFGLAHLFFSTSLSHLNIYSNTSSILPFLLSLLFVVLTLYVNFVVLRSNRKVGTKLLGDYVYLYQYTKTIKVRLSKINSVEHYSFGFLSYYKILTKRRSYGIFLIGHPKFTDSLSQKNISISEKKLSFVPALYFAVFLFVATVFSVLLGDIYLQTFTLIALSAVTLYTWLTNAFLNQKLMRAFFSITALFLTSSVLAIPKNASHKLEYIVNEAIQQPTLSSQTDAKTICQNNISAQSKKELWLLCTKLYTLSKNKNNRNPSRAIAYAKYATHLSNDRQYRKNLARLMACGYHHLNRKVESSSVLRRYGLKHWSALSCQ